MTEVDLKFCATCACGYEWQPGWGNQCGGCRRAEKFEYYSKELQTALLRAVHLGLGLLEQVPEFTGVIGPAGEREDDYIALNLAEEFWSMKKLAEVTP